MFLSSKPQLLPYHFVTSTDPLFKLQWLPYHFVTSNDPLFKLQGLPSHFITSTDPVFKLLWLPYHFTNPIHSPPCLSFNCYIPSHFVTANDPVFKLQWLPSHFIIFRLTSSLNLMPHFSLHTSLPLTSCSLSPCISCSHVFW